MSGTTDSRDIRTSGLSAKSGLALRLARLTGNGPAERQPAGRPRPAYRSDRLDLDRVRVRPAPAPLPAVRRRCDKSHSGRRPPSGASAPDRIGRHAVPLGHAVGRQVREAVLVPARSSLASAASAAPGWRCGHCRLRPRRPPLRTRAGALARWPASRRPWNMPAGEAVLAMRGSNAWSRCSEQTVTKQIRQRAADGLVIPPVRQRWQFIWNVSLVNIERSAHRDWLPGGANRTWRSGAVHRPRRAVPRGSASFLHYVKNRPPANRPKGSSSPGLWSR